MELKRSLKKLFNSLTQKIHFIGRDSLWRISEMPADPLSASLRIQDQSRVMRIWKRILPVSRMLHDWERYI